MGFLIVFSSDELFCVFVLFCCDYLYKCCKYVCPFQNFLVTSFYCICGALFVFQGIVWAGTQVLLQMLQGFDNVTYFVSLMIRFLICEV